MVSSIGGCAHQTTYASPNTSANISATNSAKHQTIDMKLVQPASLDETIKIASFNIQVFGQSKRENEDIVDILTKTVRNFDIVAIQEFRDETETTLPYFVDRINKMNGDKYDYVTSPRLGRTSSKENYAFIYNTRTVTYKNNSYVYNDKNDVFEREPFVAEFKAGKFDFILVDIHTKPEDAKNEIKALVDVVNDADTKFSNDKDVIVLGDYNGDGSYFDESTTSGFKDNKYFWAIPDSFDTTVAKSDNTYDRIVFQTEFTKEDFAGDVGVFRFDKIFNLTANFTSKVSDHYPVFAIFYTNKDTDVNK